MVPLKRKLNSIGNNGAKLVLFMEYVSLMVCLLQKRIGTL